MDEPFQDLFKIKGNRKKVEIGNILIAEPFLEGKYFSRSVVFMVEHDEQGSIGFVLNKPIGIDTSALLSEFDGVRLPVYLGGPVENNQLYYFHRHAELVGAVHVCNGIYWGGDFDLLIQMLKMGQIKAHEIRFFAGYSGWDKGQLEDELEENSWMLGEITTEMFFELPNENMWEDSMNALGGRYRVWSNFPEDPTMN